MNSLYLILSLLVLLSCGNENTATNETPIMEENNLAKITSVEFSGQPNNYTFSVTIESPDTGCDQYADWWEVFTADNTLIYRRILGHSHVNEQPFTRSGGIVDIGPDEFIYVRAHMNNTGYGTQVFSGTINEGLKLDSLETSHANELASQSPLPQDCAF